MRMLGKLAAAATGVALIGLAAGPAFADPPAGVTPRATDVVGTGSDTTQYLMDQISLNYDNANKSATSKLYSFDAVNPDTLALGDMIKLKARCAAIARPDGSSAGISTLNAKAQPSGNTANYCADYARSSRPRKSTDPPYASGGVAFVAYAQDAVTYATRSKAAGGTNAPGNLTQTQLKNIFLCKVTNWDKVGGKNAPIHVYIPQSSSGTLAFWELALGGGTTPITPGACANDLPTKAFSGGTLEENEGINKVFNDPDAIFPFSVGSFLSQYYRSPACTHPNCGEVSATQPPCKVRHRTTQNAFGCNETGYLTLNEINGTKPTTPWPLPAAPHSIPLINKHFDSLFLRFLFNVVSYDTNTADHIPAGESGAPGGLNLEKLFGAIGYICSKESGAIKDYGFLPIINCGSTS